MRCPAPGVNTTLAEGDRMSATIGLQMDGVENLTMLGVGITVYPNPTFSQFTNVRSFSQNDDIFLTIEVRITSVCLLPVCCLSVCLSVCHVFLLSPPLGLWIPLHFRASCRGSHSVQHRVLSLYRAECELDIQCELGVCGVA